MNNAKYLLSKGNRWTLVSFASVAPFYLLPHPSGEGSPMPVSPSPQGSKKISSIATLLAFCADWGRESIKQVFRPNGFDECDPEQRLTDPGIESRNNGGG
jgi:hypothetical protein